MHRYQDLKVWQKSMDLVEKVYSITNQLPSKEQFGLTSQINRSAVSIPSNIAEGAGRNSPREFNQFLGIASGSLFELETQLIIVKRVGYLSDDSVRSSIELIGEIHKMIYGLKRNL